MNCKNCGSPLAPGGIFCPNCGTKNETAAPEFSPVPSNLRMSSSFSNGAAPTPATPPRTAAPTPTYPTAPTPTYSAAPTPAYSAAPAPGYPAPAYPAAPKKSKKPLIIAIAAVACVAILAVVLILVLGGGTPKTPEQAMEQLADAMEKGDLDAACRAIGVDYRKYIEIMVQDMYEELDEDIDELRDYFVATANGKEWRNRAKNINSVNDAVSVLYDYAKESFAEEAEDGDYEDYIEDLRDAEFEELSSKEKKNYIDNLESRYEDKEDMLLFKLDDIEEVYTCKINGSKRYIVQTKQGCFIIGLLGIVS